LGNGSDVDDRQLLRPFDYDSHPGANGFRYFIVGLGSAGVDDLLWAGSGELGATKLAVGNDVEAETLVADQPQNLQVHAGFDREPLLSLRESAVESGAIVQNRPLVVDVERGETALMWNTSDHFG
jgi:hypothetical protein